MTILSNFYEDIVVGERFELGAKTFDTDYIKGFAVNYDPQSFHVDEEAAKKSHFGALCASGWQTISTWMRFYVDLNMADRAAKTERGEALPEIGVSPGIEQLKWKRPVYVGRAEGAATATGVLRHHLAQQAKLVNEALTL